MIHVNIWVTGKVQGVNFRATTREKALEYDLHGFVCNEMNGSVYIEVEGADEKVNKLLEWCSCGPSHAQVTNVMVDHSDVKGFSGFEVRRN